MQKPRRLKILSIDFDYFQNVNPFTLQYCYPDGIDLPTAISSIVWAGHYANPKTKKLLDDVTILENELNELRHVLHHNIQNTAPVMITNSHVHIYDFIHEACENMGADTVNILNIDMHHDIYNQSETLDCGNWVRHIMSDFKDAHLSWIANPVSFQMYEMDDYLQQIVMKSIKKIRHCKFDAVFLCRSDNWFVPHLDNHFHELVQLIASKFPHTIIESSVEQPRNIQKYIQQLTQVRQNMCCDNV